MSLEILSAMLVFALASSITPGPNNWMLMSSGVNFGFMLSLPHMLGVSLGFVIMAILVGLGIMQLFELFPVSYQVLKILSVVYMVYLATKIARSSTAIGDIKTKVKPITFF